MPGFDELEVQIRRELKNYSDEDMMWIYDKLMDISSHYPGYNSLEFKDIENLTKILEVRDLVIKKLLKELKLSKKNPEDFLEKIKINKLIFLNNELFSQYKKDLRLCLFSINYLQYEKIECNILLTDAYSFKLTTQETIYIKLIFFLYKNNIKKEDIEESIKIYYQKILNKVNKSKNFQDQLYLDWTYNYLKSKYSEFNFEYCLNNENYYFGVISYLDFYSFINTSEFTLLTLKLNKAWSQKKFRDADKIKTNYHLPLTIACKDKLKKLAKFHNKTESQVLELIIEKVYLKEMCDENGNLIYE